MSAGGFLSAARGGNLASNTSIFVSFSLKPFSKSSQFFKKKIEGGAQGSREALFL